MDLTKGIFRNNIDSIDYLLIKGIETQLKQDLFLLQAEVEKQFSTQDVRSLEIKVPKALLLQVGCEYKSKK